MAIRVYRQVSQDVCPWSVRFARALAEDSPFQPRETLAGKDARQLARELLGMTQEEFSRAFKGSPMKRAKLRGLRRDASVLLGNVGSAADVPALAAVLADEEQQASRILRCSGPLLAQAVAMFRVARMIPQRRSHTCSRDCAKRAARGAGPARGARAAGRLTVGRPRPAAGAGVRRLTCDASRTSPRAPFRCRATPPARRGHMPAHDLIVIGASAGGVEALGALVAGLPPDLPAAVCVVVHLRAYAESRLAEVLSRAGPLPAVAAQHGAPLRPGTIHVAVPDLHLLVEPGGEMGTLRLTRGPRENRSRPAADPLFRSAALAFGPRVVGVILSGALDDGTAGLWAVRDRGGLSVVQDPNDALLPSMPQSALDEVGADHVAPAAALGALLGRLAREPVAATAHGGQPSDDGRETHAAAYKSSGRAPDTVIEREVAMAAIDESAHQVSERYGVPSRFACPECGGVLWDVSGDGPARFRCETGHAYSPACLAEDQTEQIEAALWAALRATEDRVELARLRAGRAVDMGLGSFAQQFTAQEEAAQQHATALRALLRLDGRTGIRPRTEPASGGARGSVTPAASADPGPGARATGARATGARATGARRR